MSGPPDPVFLERRTYRRRRLGDAARLLPVAGAILLVLPVFWADDATTSGGLIFVFAVWAVLIALSALMSRRLSDADPPGERDGLPPGGRD